MTRYDIIFYFTIFYLYGITLYDIVFVILCHTIWYCIGSYHVVFWYTYCIMKNESHMIYYPVDIIYCVLQYILPVALVSISYGMI